MTGAALLGAAAAALQLLSYTVYIRLVLAGRCAPNGMSWLMWSYGTGVLVFVQADLGTPLSVLATPALCVLCAAFVTIRAFASFERVPPARQDWVVLAIDVLILGSYLACARGTPDGTPDKLVNFVVLPALSSLLSAWPIVRTTWADPCREHPWPWLLSAASDGLVAAAVLAEGLGWQYLAYPVVTLATQLPVAALALRAPTPRPALALATSRKGVRGFRSCRRAPESGV